MAQYTFAREAWRIAPTGISFLFPSSSIVFQPTFVPLEAAQWEMYQQS